MQTKKTNKPSREQRQTIKAILQAIDEQLARVRVTNYHNKGKVTAHANLGHRRIHVRGSLKNIVKKFVIQYAERLPTAQFLE